MDATTASNSATSNTLLAPGCARELHGAQRKLGFATGSHSGPSRRSAGEMCSITSLANNGFGQNGATPRSPSATRALGARHRCVLGAAERFGVHFLFAAWIGLLPQSASQQRGPLQWLEAGRTSIPRTVSAPYVVALSTHAYSRGFSLCHSRCMPDRRRCTLQQVGAA